MQWGPPPGFSPWEPGVVSLAVYLLMVLGLVALLLFLSSWLGERRVADEKQRPFEGGIIPTGPAQLHHPAPFHLVAIFFLIFDVEAIYIFSWAIAFHSLGWAGWLGISFFIAVLLVSLLYIWKKRGLDWGPIRKRDRRARA
jgi:NADH-quinone oxidoreductase subunit A